MLTPADVHNKEFSRGFRGYREEEVDDFLEEIISDFEELYNKISNLEDELSVEREKVTQYQATDKKLRDTLTTAQMTAGEAVNSAKLRIEDMERAAKEECERMHRQTEADVKRRLEEADAKIKERQDLYDAILLRERQFIVRLRSLLRSELAMLDDGPEEIIEAAEEDNAPKPVRAEEEKGAMPGPTADTYAVPSWIGKRADTRVEDDTIVLVKKRKSECQKGE